MQLEKVCVNITPAELGKIDLLVARGLYASRTDLIRTGIRQMLERDDATVTHVAKGSTGIGFLSVTQDDLEKSLAFGERQRMFVIGVLRIDPAVTPDLADQTIDRINILGSIKGPKEVLERLGPRIIHGLPASD